MSDTAKELRDIKEQMLELIEMAQNLVRGTPVEDRAYWIPEIRCALDNDHEYVGLGESECTMQSTINALSEKAEAE